MSRRSARGQDRLANAVLWVALGLWILNDAVLKWHFASPLTGKLSDAAALFALPAALARLTISSYRRDLLLHQTWIGIVFVAINLDQSFNDQFTAAFWRPVWGGFERGVADPTDLLCLAAFALAHLPVLSPGQPCAHRLRPATVAALFVTGIASVATSRPHSHKPIELALIGFPAVYLESPQDGAEVGDPIAFRWKYVGSNGGDALSDPPACSKAACTFVAFRLHIASDPAFHNQVASVDTTESEISTASPTSGRYYWRVATVWNDADSAERPQRVDTESSQVRSFAVN